MMFEKIRKEAKPPHKHEAASVERHGAPQITVEGMEAPPVKSIVSAKKEAGTTAQDGDIQQEAREGQKRAEKLSGVLSELSNLPLWVQQVIYTDLKEHLEKNVTMRTLGSMTRENFLQLWSPTLTAKGLAAVRNHHAIDNPKITKALVAIQKYDNVALMCARYSWSLHEGCLVLNEAIELELINPPVSKTQSASLQFIGDRIRIGEYLQQIGCLEPEQLEQALQTQHYIENAMGERTRIADILVRLELVTHEDVESILFLKNESRKPFQLF